MNRTKLGIITLLLLLGVVVISYLNSSGLSILGVKTFEFEFSKTQNNPELDGIVKRNLEGVEGNFAVFIEELPASPANRQGGTASPSAALKNPKKYVLNEMEIFPAASLYKLVLLAAVFKEIEGGGLKLEDKISSNKTHLKEVFGGVDFGYEEGPEQIIYTVDEALTRVGRISDNFAAIMLTEKLREARIKKGSSDKLLMEMAKELGMANTDFEADPIKTTAFDIATYFRKLYFGQIVSPQSSEQIIGYLSLSQINNRIPAGLPASPRGEAGGGQGGPEGVKVVHKTGELSRIRHDAGLVFPPNTPNSPHNPYIIVLLSKDLKYEGDGIEVLAKISKEVYGYFSGEELVRSGEFRVVQGVLDRI